jgi:hypothetical protein
MIDSQRSTIKPSPLGGGGDPRRSFLQPRGPSEGVGSKTGQTRRKGTASHPPTSVDAHRRKDTLQKLLCDGLAILPNIIIRSSKIRAR